MGMGRENTFEGSLNGFRYNCILRLITYFKKECFLKDAYTKMFMIASYVIMKSWK